MSNKALSVAQASAYAIAATHTVIMPAEESTTPPELLQRVIWIQSLTLISMSMEVVVSLGAAWMARSPALLFAISRRPRGAASRQNRR